MHDSEAPRTVLDPVNTAPSQNGKTEETAGGEIPLAPLYLGMAATRIDGKTVKFGFLIYDGLHTNDYCINEFTQSDGENMADLIRFVGAGVTPGLEGICPGICPHLWRKLDIVCMLLKAQPTPSGTRTHGDTSIDTDEPADGAARECVRCFCPDHNPALAICFRNNLIPDAEVAVGLVEDLQEYKDTVHESTWNTVLKYAYELRGYNDGQTNGDPQSEPMKVALIRHALVQFCSQLGVDRSWYIHQTDPEALRITKTNHNILLGVADPEERFGPEGQAILDKWMRSNAERYWLPPGGPVSPGGADVVIMDDPQMPALIPLIKQARPEVKIIYRSHIEVCKDLVAIPGSPQRQVWQWIWKHVRKADVFISHPMSTFVPHGVPLAMVGLMPASTHWLDGLNKPLGEWDLRFYHNNLRNLCNEREM
ncbi:hypothetical protein HOY80DRAFT_1116434 [Tuber brumale]|nr:hypothetical protein HOY80DRAFT_1116434 [Tuber brumale]